jgi:hypothetical protein
MVSDPLTDLTAVISAYYAAKHLDGLVRSSSYSNMPTIVKDNGFLFFTLYTPKN